MQLALNCIKQTSGDGPHSGPYWCVLLYGPLCRAASLASRDDELLRGVTRWEAAAGRRERP